MIRALGMISWLGVLTSKRNKFLKKEKGPDFQAGVRQRCCTSADKQQTHTYTQQKGSSQKNYCLFRTLNNHIWGFIRNSWRCWQLHEELSGVLHPPAPRGAAPPVPRGLTMMCLLYRNTPPPLPPKRTNYITQIWGNGAERAPSVNQLTAGQCSQPWTPWSDARTDCSVAPCPSSWSGTGCGHCAVAEIQTQDSDNYNKADTSLR